MAYDTKQVIAIRKNLEMRRGKEIAQGAHASRYAAKRADGSVTADWEQSGQTKIVVGIGGEEEALELHQAASGNVPVALVRDAGHTEVEAGTVTAVAIGPARSEDVDVYTGDLKLL